MGIPIGRELYTAPRIWVYGDKCRIKQGQNGRPQCYDTFSVDRIEVDGNRITYLSIRNNDTRNIVFVWASDQMQDEPQDNRQEYGDEPPTEKQLENIGGLIDTVAKIRNVGSDIVIRYLMDSNAVKASGVVNGTIATARQAETAIGQLKAWLDGSGV